jgi:hypothetical protein
MANTFEVTSTHKAQHLALRGDMTGANLGFTPADNKFPIRFYTEDAKQYVITALNQFRVRGANSVDKKFIFGGEAGLWVEFMYEPAQGVWVLTKHGGASSTGSGGVGSTMTFAVDSTITGAPGSQALVEDVGSGSNIRLKFTIPAPAAASSSGATLPSGGDVGYFLGKTGPAADQYAWLQPPSGGTGGTGGVAFTPEVLLTQSADGSITINKSLGNSFRVLLTKNGVMKNPVGYQPGEEITIAMRQGPLGPFTLDWELNWAHPDRQLPVLSKQPGGLNTVLAYLTDAIDANNPGGWITEIGPKASTIGYGVPAYVARNVQTGVEYYVLRSPTQLSGMTSMQPGQTLKILRNGLGIEAYGAVDSGNGAGNYLITGALPNGNRAELRTGPGVRSAFDRGVLAFGGDGVNATVQDIILSGAREQSGASRIAQGVSLTGGANVTLKNVRLYDNENGILSANDYTGTLALVDCEFDGNAVGDDGFTHNIYMGHHNQGWSALRTTFKNARLGHNIKSRSGVTTLNQVHCYSSFTGRELDVPNGGKLSATDCIFEKTGNFQQNDLVRIVEGFDLDTARPREYVFRNCKFISPVSSGAAGSYVWNNDPDVDVYLIDCVFVGAKGNGASGAEIWPGTDANGNRGRVIVQFTPGVTPGPRVPVGYQPLAVTPVAG